MRCDKIQIEGLSVIVPTFNEADNIEDVLDRIENTIKMIKKREIIIVDDSSPDNTGEIAENIRKKYGNMRIINRTGERGLASSIIDGMKNSNYDIICVMDADLQHPPEIILEMIEKIQEGNELVIASRYIKNGEIRGWSITRKIISKGAVLLTRFLISSARGVKDPMSGYFMLRKGNICYDKLNPIGFKILLEIIHNIKCKKIEVPYIFMNRKKGKSKLSSKHYIEFLRQIVNIII